MQIDERGGVSIEDGIALFLERYGLDSASEPLHHLIRSLGYLDDCEDDEAVPMSKHDLAAWWRKRQAEVIRNLWTSGRAPRLCSVLFAVALQRPL